MWNPILKRTQKKFAHHWTGPFMVVSTTGTGAYTVRGPGDLLDTQVVNVQRMKVFISRLLHPTEPPEGEERVVETPAVTAPTRGPPVYEWRSPWVAQQENTRAPAPILTSQIPAIPPSLSSQPPTNRAPEPTHGVSVEASQREEESMLMPQVIQEDHQPKKIAHSKQHKTVHFAPALQTRTHTRQTRDDQQEPREQCEQETDQEKFVRELNDVQVLLERQKHTRYRESAPEAVKQLLIPIYTQGNFITDEERKVEFRRDIGRCSTLKSLQALLADHLRDFTRVFAAEIASIESKKLNYGESWRQ